MLEECGVTEKLTWKQTLMGCKGRMNPAMYQLWQPIRGIIIAKIWQDRNLVTHRRPGINLDSFHIKGLVREGCLRASEKRKLKIPTTILLRKISRIKS